jgi:hypothetical protein
MARCCPCRISYPSVSKSCEGSCIERATIHRGKGLRYPSEVSFSGHFCGPKEVKAIISDERSLPNGCLSYNLV